METQQPLGKDNQYIEYLTPIGKNARAAAASLRMTSTSKKNSALIFLSEELNDHRSEIKKANAQDIENAKEMSLSAPLLERLKITDKTIDSMIASVTEIGSFADPVGEIINGYTLANGLRLQKKRVPIGVLAVIYESRPNVTIDVAALALKSSNAVILRGGKEALHSNQYLCNLFQKALEKNQINANSIQLITKTDRSIINPLVQMSQYIDLIVPRGGAGLIQYVSQNATIPVIKHDKGTCHIYVHSSAPFEMAKNVIINSKTQRPSVCNAVESLIIDNHWPHTKGMLETLSALGVRLHSNKSGQEQARKINFMGEIHELMEDGFGAEYLDLSMSLSFYDNQEGAMEHIKEYSSGHTEAILSNDFESIEIFQRALDSAAIMVNCSTRFHDGGQFGLGAEVGIATGKLHVRGPMGLTDLTTMQYQVIGEGQIRK